MKTIGIIGGMSWESSGRYYAIINRTVRDRLGPSRSAKILLHSVDFGPIADLQAAGDWDGLGSIMAGAARSLQAGGADCVVIATNTMHKVAERVQSACDLPLLHIADAVGEAVAGKSIQKVALLGTSFTMEQDFLKGRLAQSHGLEVIVPESDDAALVHRIIYDELIAGKVLENSRRKYRDIIARLADRGCEGIILGCTEIGLLISDEDSPVEIFDTALLHARAAAAFALD